MSVEIHAILGIAFAAIKLRDNLRHNTRKSNSLIKCLQAVKAPLESIDHAERDRIQVSHDETLRLLKDVIDRAHELLQKQTKHQNPVVKTFQSTKVRDQFHEIQIDLQAHLQTLNLSVGVLSGVQLQKIQQGLDIIKEVNGEALEEHLSTLRENQGIILENQNTTHGNQRSMLGKADVALRNQDEMKTLLSNIIQAQLNMSGNVVGNNTYVTNDHSTTTTNNNNNNNNVTNNYQDQRSNVSDSDYSRTIKPKKPEPYVKRKTKLHIAAEKGSLSEVEVALREYFIDHETPNGSTALLLAVENGHVEVVKELLLVGVDFTVKANQKAWMKVLEVGGNVGDRAIDDNDDDNDDLHLIPRFLEGGVDANGKFGKLEDILTPLDEIKILKGYEGESKKQALLKTLVDRYSGDNHGLSDSIVAQMLAFLRMIQNDDRIDDEYWRRFQDFASIEQIHIDTSKKIVKRLWKVIFTVLMILVFLTTRYLKSDSLYYNEDIQTPQIEVSDVTNLNSFTRAIVGEMRTQFASYGDVGIKVFDKAILQTIKKHKNTYLDLRNLWFLNVAVLHVRKMAQMYIGDQSIGNSYVPSLSLDTNLGQITLTSILPKIKSIVMIDEPKFQESMYHNCVADVTNHHRDLDEVNSFFNVGNLIYKRAISSETRRDAQIDIISSQLRCFLFLNDDKYKQLLEKLKTAFDIPTNDMANQLTRLGTGISGVYGVKKMDNLLYFIDQLKGLRSSS